MKTLINEFLIRWYGMRLCRAQTIAMQGFYLAKMTTCIKRRDAQQIARMERKRGLI